MQLCTLSVYTPSYITAAAAGVCLCMRNLLRDCMSAKQVSRPAYFQVSWKGSAQGMLGIQDEGNGAGLTFGSAPAARAACGSRGIGARSTRACDSPWPCGGGCSPSAPPSSPTPPSAGRSAGRFSVPGTHTQNFSPLSQYVLWNFDLPANDKFKLGGMKYFSVLIMNYTEAPHRCLFLKTARV